MIKAKREGVGRMDLKMLKASGEAGETLSVHDQVFGVPFNEALAHQVVVATLATARAGTQAQKNRAQVRGGGAKPWRQKGTGRARAGTRSSPIWRGGGCTFAARPRSYAQKVNRKMYRGAMRTILSELIRQERLVVLADYGAVSEPKTKQALALLKLLLYEKKGIRRVLWVDDPLTEVLYLATRNVHMIELVDAQGVSVVDLVGSDMVVMSLAALRVLEGCLA